MFIVQVYEINYVLFCSVHKYLTFDLSIYSIMVLDNGLIKEFGPPRELLKEKEGIFHSMAKDARLI